MKITFQAKHFTFWIGSPFRVSKYPPSLGKWWLNLSVIYIERWKKNLRRKCVEFDTLYILFVCVCARIKISRAREQEKRSEISQSVTLFLAFRRGGQIRFAFSHAEMRNLRLIKQQRNEMKFNWISVWKMYIYIYYTRCSLCLKHALKLSNPAYFGFHFSLNQFMLWMAWWEGRTLLSTDHFSIDVATMSSLSFAW